MTSLKTSTQIMSDCKPFTWPELKPDAIAGEHRTAERRAITALEQKRIAEQFIQAALVLCPEWQDVYNMTGYAGLCSALACEVESYGIRGSLSDALLCVMAGAVLA